MKYDFKATEAKWQKIWDEQKTFKTKNDKTNKTNKKQKFKKKARTENYPSFLLFCCDF